VENLTQGKRLGAQAHFDGASFTLMLKQQEAELLYRYLQEDIGNLRPVLPRSVLTLLEALEKALARKEVSLLWKREPGGFAWQRSTDWIELRLFTDQFKDFVESASAMPNFTRDPGPPSEEPNRRWPSLSDVTIMIKILAAMHKRQGLQLGRRATLEIAGVFGQPEN
jgi:hypothetical protein